MKEIVDILNPKGLAFNYANEEREIFLRAIDECPIPNNEFHVGELDSGTDGAGRLNNNGSFLVETATVTDLQSFWDVFHKLQAEAENA